MSPTVPVRRRPPPAGFDSLEQEAYLQLWRTYDRLREIEERVFQSHGITAQQYNALRILRSVRPGSLATSALGARLVSRAADMTRLLDRLEELGHVARARTPENRRVVLVTITADGVAVVQRLAVAVRRLAEEQLGHLDRRTLRSLIEILVRAREPHEDPAAAAPWPGSSPRGPGSSRRRRGASRR